MLGLFLDRLISPLVWIFAFSWNWSFGDWDQHRDYILVFGVFDFCTSTV